MPSSRTPGPYPIPGASMPTWLVRFDERGQCVSPATEAALLEHLKASDYSHVLFHSHGWNTDFADALDQYSRFLAAFAAVIATRPLADFKPIFVGVTWPSVWMAEEAGPAMASASDDAGVRSGIVAGIAAPMNDTDRERLYALTDVALLDRAAALDLARLLAPSLGNSAEEVDGEAEAALDAEDIVECAVRLAEAEGTTPIPAAPDPLDFDATGQPPVQATGFAEAIDPRNLLRLFSLFQMKDRAGQVGANGVAMLLRRLLAATPARVNVFGHSFGAKVMLSAICAPAPLPRKVDTLLLLQPAISHLAMASVVPGRDGPGGYRAALDRVEGPISTTFSELDQPLHDVFHLALRRSADLGEMRIAAAGEPPNKYAALGGYGPRHSGERLVRPIPAPGAGYGDLAGARLVGLDGSDRRINGHGDVATPFTAWALRRLIAGD